MLHHRLGRSAALLAGLAVLVSAVSVTRAADEGKYRHLQAALYEMREARGELKDAKHDFGGHREKAAKSLDAAIDQIEKALKFAKVDYRDIKREKYKFENAPHLRAAAEELREAKNEVKDSKDFGEHKEAMLREIDSAQTQLDEAIKFAK